MMLLEKPHPSHFHLPQAITCATRVQPAYCLLTGLSHRLDHSALEATLKEQVGDWMRPALDGLCVQFKK